MVVPHGVGAEVDVYYIGALAAWAITGVEPSPGNMPLPEDPAWASLVTKATQTDPHDRPQSMVDVLAELHAMREEFAAARLAAAATQGALFAEHPCGACGADVVAMRCTQCGAYYATYN